MQSSQLLLLCAVAVAGASATSSPLGKAVDLLAGLKTQISKEAEEAAKINAEKEAWCKDRRSLSLSLSLFVAI